jgi:glycosyltransferase involved in cell wall biosynthesis
MRWWIVEDALRDRRGHWFEYVSTFVRDLRALGDEVTTLADRAAEPFLQQQLDARPVLPESIWHRMSDGAGALRRYARVPQHAWQTRQAIRGWLRANPAPDLIFVPTVLVHHLLGWTWLIRGALRETRTRVLLFFPNTPVRLDPTTREPVWNPAPTSKLFAYLLRKLAPEVAAGRVILGAETLPMRDALTKVSGVPFTYLPHPVAPLAPAASPGPQPATPVFASYGPARHEKGSDILQAALKRFRAQSHEAKVRFAVQWLEAFRDDRGNLVARDPELERDPQVEFITRFFGDGEYGQRLAATSALLLPYRLSSYALRVSRVVIEAMVNGLPVVATRGTTLAAQAEQFGALVPCQDGDAPSLAAAISTLAAGFEGFQATARQRMSLAREHFSVAHFRALLAA